MTGLRHYKEGQTLHINRFIHLGGIMGIKNIRKSHHISTKLLRMLEFLNFSVIKARCHSGYSYSETYNSIKHILDYSPWSLAMKHDVEYLFEYVNNHGDVIKL